MSDYKIILPPEVSPNLSRQLVIGSMISDSVSDQMCDMRSSKLLMAHIPMSVHGGIIA